MQNIIIVTFTIVIMLLMGIFQTISPNEYPGG